MARQYQQQALMRKLIYSGLILALFTFTLIWRHGLEWMAPGLWAGTNRQAERLAIREESRGEVDLTGAVVRLGLTGSRGLATCILWNEAIDKQKKNQWNEMEVLVRSITKLQPHFITPWLFQSWNLAYNVSVESDRVRDKYFYISRGVELLAEGERQNTYHPDLRWSIGFYMQHKINLSDEKNYKRSLLQLSMIPPNERDPARFWKEGADGREINYEQFEDFCKQHPQLVRRLKEGLHRETLQEKKKQFTCEKPENVVEFLEDNFSVPALYKVDPLPVGIPSHSRPWDPNKKYALLEPIQRFPVMPPAQESMFDKTALATDFSWRDDIDGYTVAHAWFSYAQEPLPLPSTELPGNSQEITDQARQRRPKHMTTLIFRNYPAQACRYMAERLQEEGWYDEDAWDAGEWFQETKAGKDYRYGGGKAWTLEAWLRAFRAWEHHGNQNLILFPSEATEQNMRESAKKFVEKYRLQPNGAPPNLRREDLNPEERRWYEATIYLFEYDFYRRVSHFPHHYLRCLMEAKEETVACRKLFYKAEQLEQSASPRPALDTYRTPIEVKSVRAWAGKKLTPLEAWRDLVLRTNREFRNDNFTQEQTAEYELRYLRLLNRFDGRELKEQLAKAAVVVPLLVPFNPTDFRGPVTLGPYSGTVVIDGKDTGESWVDETNREVVMDRMGLMSRRKQAGGQPAAAPTGPMGPDGMPMPSRGALTPVEKK